MEKLKSSAWRLLPAAMLERWPHISRIDHVCISTVQLVRFHKNTFDEILRKLDSTENAHLFEQY